MNPNPDSALYNLKLAFLTGLRTSGRIKPEELRLAYQNLL
jgi:hypothetical protein